MSNLTTTWIALSLFTGFIIYLIPRLARYLAVAVALMSIAYGVWVLAAPVAPLTLQLLDNFGVTLIVDSLSGYFILTNALVTFAVLLACWQSDRTAFFYMQMVILHGSVNAVFICADFISLYVALEVISIATFLLIAYPRTDRSIWVALRYLFVSNTAMLFYLVGAGLVYQTHHSFSFTGLWSAPPDAIALIFLGLMTKGGIFVSGLWLPFTHSQAATPVSALLSGVVVKTGVFALVRCALMAGEVPPLFRWFGIGAAFLGVTYAIFESDTKRVLASSTVSQLGWILVAPEVGGVYALAHGLAKSTLFLIVGALPSRDLKQLQQQPIPTALWLPLAIAGLSISGFPLLVGFGAKALTLKSLSPWQNGMMSLAAVGTAVVYAKFIFLPQKRTPAAGSKETLGAGFWWAVTLLSITLLVASAWTYDTYTLANLVKAVAIVAVGWLVYFLMVRRSEIHLPHGLEQLEHLIGVMSLILLMLFWMVRI